MEILHDDNGAEPWASKTTFYSCNTQNIIEIVGTFGTSLNVAWLAAMFYLRYGAQMTHAMTAVQDLLLHGLWDQQAQFSLRIIQPGKTKQPIL